MIVTLYKVIAFILLRMPDWFFAAFFAFVFPLYKATHQNRAYGRVEHHLKNASEVTSKNSVLRNVNAKDVFKGIYWNAIDSYRGLTRLKRTVNSIVFENENIIFDAMAKCVALDGTPLPIAAISIHQGPFELLHRSLCRYSDNVHLITDSVGDNATRNLLKDFRSDPHLTEYHPDELQKMLRNLWTPPQKLGKSKNAILAMVVDQGRHTKGNTVCLFNQPSTLYLRLPQKINQMGAGIVTFRTFTRSKGNGTSGKEIVIRFESFYPPKFDGTSSEANACKKNGNTNLVDCIAKEIESWISEHPKEWCWNYHGNFKA